MVVAAVVQATPRPLLAVLVDYRAAVQVVAELLKMALILALALLVVEVKLEFGGSHDKSTRYY